MNTLEPDTLTLEQVLNGKLYAWGLFEARFGSLQREFLVEIDGHWDGHELTLDERFLYRDGERDRRRWQIQRIGEGQYRGHTDGIIGEASGQVAGNHLRWRYRLRLKTAKGDLSVSFDDSIFSRTGGMLVNRARIRKWGILVGEVTLFFCPADRLSAPPFSL